MNKKFSDTLVSMSELLEIYPFLASDSAIDEQNKLRRMIREHKIPFIKVNGKIRFPIEIINLWMEGHKHGPEAKEYSKSNRRIQMTIAERLRNGYII